MRSTNLVEVVIYDAPVAHRGGCDCGCDHHHGHDHGPGHSHTHHHRDAFEKITPIEISFDVHELNRDSQGLGNDILQKAENVGNIDARLPRLGQIGGIEDAQKHHND